MRNETLQPFHLVIRFSDTMFGVGNVVARHNDIVTAHGAVWFGKLGQTFSQSRVDLLNKQIEKNIPTFLYLVRGNYKKSTAFRSQLQAVSKSIPEETILIPVYYAEKDLLQYMKVWVKFGEIEPIDFTEMNNFKAIHSVYPLSETLTRSSSGYFLVREKHSSI